MFKGHFKIASVYSICFLEQYLSNQKKKEKKAEFDEKFIKTMNYIKTRKLLKKYQEENSNEIKKRKTCQNGRQK